jgi:hypothetical protein
VKKKLLFPTVVTVLVGLQSGAAEDVIKFQAARTVQGPVSFQGDSDGSASLTNLNPSIGSWFLLNVSWSSSDKHSYHIENPQASRLGLTLTDKGLILQDAKGKTLCDVFNSGSDSFLKKAASTSGGYSSICGGKLSIRKTTSGSAGGVSEWGANFLRDTLGSTGESIVNSYKENLKSDGSLSAVQVGSATQSDQQNIANAPQAAVLNSSSQKRLIQVPGLDLEIKTNNLQRNVIAGDWYALKNHQGIFFSAFQPNMIDSSILNSFKDRTQPLDHIESQSLAYFVAFDLSQYQIGWSHGTRLPGVGWSKRNDRANTNQSAGPDGFNNLSPLGLTGALNPAYLPRLAATMCGGFQRFHSTFKAGALANVNDGSYYGFVQEGVVMSRLNPGLATIIVSNDGEVKMKTWTEADKADLPKIRYARQNGVPLIETDALGRGVPGRLVGNWGEGNWSGSAAGALRSQRAAACISHHNGRKFLIYGYFSSANPSGMSRALQALNCDYAVHLDMNSAGQGYMGLFSRSGEKYKVEHPVSEMAGRDTKLRFNGNAVPAPRYVGTPDEADFFFILRK